MSTSGNVTSKSDVRVLVVDDHELVRHGLKLMIGNEPDLLVCAEAENEQSAIEHVHASRPDLVIVDIALKSGNGIDLVKRIKAHDRSIHIIVQSMHDEKLYGERALRAGAQGYVNKQDPARTILKAVREVLAGRTFFSRSLTDHLLQRAIRSGVELQRSPMEKLSDRELEVFRLVGQGYTSAEIARHIHISRSTVDTYRERLKVKLNAKSGAELTHQATLWVLENDGS